MAQYVVLEPTGAKAISGKVGTGFPSVIATEENSDKTVFVRDGFYVLALILPFVWLLFQRLWFEAFAVLGITVLLGFAGAYFGIADAVPLLTILVSLFVAFEGASWKIAKLKRQGYTERAAIDAVDLEEAEIRYFYGRDVPETARAQTLAPAWEKQASRPGYSSTGSTIGFVGHRGEH